MQNKWKNEKINKNNNNKNEKWTRSIICWNDKCSFVEMTNVHF